MNAVVVISKTHLSPEFEEMPALLKLASKVREDEHFLDFHTEDLMGLIAELNRRKIDFAVAFPKPDR